MSKEGANWREQGGNVDGEKKCYQELHDDGAQMMHGSTMGVRTGLSFYTSAAQPATPPYLGSLQSFTPENSGLEKSRIEGGVKICLEFMRWDITSGFQLLRGGRWMVWQQQAWWQLSMYAPGERPSFRSRSAAQHRLSEL